jgi:hypothetical protein
VHFKIIFRGPFKEHSYQVWLQLAQCFSKKRKKVLKVAIQTTVVICKVNTDLLKMVLDGIFFKTGKEDLQACENGGSRWCTSLGCRFWGKHLCGFI